MHAGHVGLKSRTYMSRLHRWTADDAAQRAFVLEQRGNPKYDQAVVRQQVANASVAVVFSAAYLEAAINEVCVDATEESGGGCASDLTGGERQILARLWTLGIPKTARYSILEKYDVVLAALSRAPIERSRDPCQSIQSLVSLRNEIVHAEPEWDKHLIGVSDHKQDLSTLERQLRGKFELNTLVGEVTPFYPLRGLGYGCARWSILSAEAFLIKFLGQLGIDPFYLALDGGLRTE